MTELQFTSEDVFKLGDEAHTRGMCDGLDLAILILKGTAERRPDASALMADLVAIIELAKKQVGEERQGHE